MHQQDFSAGCEGSLDMTHTDEPSATANRIPHTGSIPHVKSERDCDEYLMTSPEYFLQYHGSKWSIAPSDIVEVTDRSARSAVVSVKHHSNDTAPRLFYLAHHPTEVWHVTKISSPSADSQ